MTSPHDLRGVSRAGNLSLSPSSPRPFFFVVLCLLLLGSPRVCQQEVWVHMRMAPTSPAKVFALNCQRVFEISGIIPNLQIRRLRLRTAHHQHVQGHQAGWQEGVEIESELANCNASLLPRRSQPSGRSIRIKYLSTMVTASFAKERDDTLIASLQAEEAV